MLAVRLFGKFEITLANQPVTIPSRPAQSLLAYLMLHADKSVRREKLAGLLWPDSDESNARNSLRQTLWQLRAAIGKEYFLADRVTVGFNSKADYQLDTDTLQSELGATTTADQLISIVSIYVDRLLPGFYDEWVLLEQERLQALFEDRMQMLLDHLVEEARWRELREWAEWWIARGQNPEPAYRALMLGHAGLGDRSGVAASYRRTINALNEKLGIAPSRETQMLYERLIRDDNPATAALAVAVPISTTDTPPQNEISSRPPAFLGEFSESVVSPMETFIGRESELSQLDQLLAQSIAGRGQMVLLTGEAGRGKTSLLNEFARRALDARPALIVAGGTCSVFTGIGDPYLPFREVLGMLSGDVETQFAAGTIDREHALRLWRFLHDAVQILVELGPHLIDTLVTARALKDRVARYAPDQASLLDDLREALDHRSAFAGEQHSDQSRIFEEYWDVLAALAARQPLLIVLDDLHWADHSSISLLSYLAMRVADSPVMLLGAYRPEDVALGREGRRHPLADVLDELKRRLGNIWIDLDRDAETLGRSFVEALLDAESNQLNEHFRQKLLRHTGGHPLFTVELLRDMQARGGLQKNEAGQWIEGSKLSWEELPARVEGVIETRIGRLDAAQQEVLSVACVEGEEFTAEIIARVLARDGRELTQHLSGDLERQYLLVQEQGIRRVGTQRLSLFRFRHNLFRKYLYDSLSNSERMYLHEAIGNALEELYRDQAGEIAAIATQLAHHFQEARIAKKAAGYLLLAGEQAARSFAYEEAISHFKRGLALLSELPDSSGQLRQAFDFELSLGKTQWKFGQVTEALDSLQRSAAIARELASSTALAQAALAYEEPRWRFNLPSDPVIRLLEEALEALGEEESALRVRVLASLARALMETNSRDRLAITVKQAVDMAHRIDDPVALYDALRIRVQIDRQPQTITQRITALNEMVQLAETIGDGGRLMVAYALRLYDLLELGEVKAAEADFHAHVQLGQKIKHVFGLYASEVYGAMWALLRGRFEEAEQLAQRALDVDRDMGSETFHGTFGIQMFSIRREQGRLNEVAPIMKLFISQNPAAAIWRPGLVLIYSDLRLDGECRETFEYLAADNFTRLPKDALWLTCIAYLAEVCAFLEDTDRAATLYRLLLPYDGRVVVVGSAVACYGAVSRFLGLLATTMCLWEQAERHFEEAVELNIHLEAWPWLAHTQHQYASMLLARGEVEDHTRAVALLEEASATAEELGMQFLIQKVKAVNVSDVRHS